MKFVPKDIIDSKATLVQIPLRLIWINDGRFDSHARASQHLDHMMTSSNGNIFRVTGHLCGEFTGEREIHRSPVNSPHKGQWRAALMFSLICVWINGWVNNRGEAGDLRRYRAHFDVTVMRCRRRDFCYDLTWPYHLIPNSMAKGIRNHTVR